MSELPSKITRLHLNTNQYDEVTEVDRMVQKYFTDREYLKRDHSSIQFLNSNDTHRSEVKLIMLDDVTEPPKFNGLSQTSASQPQERSPQQIIEDLKKIMEQFKPKTVDATAKENINCGDPVQFDTAHGDDQTVVAKWEARSHSLHLAEAHLINSGESEAIASTARMMVERYALWQEQQVRPRLQGEEEERYSGIPIRQDVLQSARESLRGFSRDPIYCNPCSEIMLPTVYEVPRYTFMGRYLDEETITGLGDQNCVNNARSPHLQCAVNPTGDCAECPHFEKE